MVCLEEYTSMIKVPKMTAAEVSLFSGFSTLTNATFGEIMKPKEGMNDRCTYCNAKNMKTKKRQHICTTCQMKLDKRCLIGADAYAGVKVYVSIDQTRQVIGEYTPHFKQGIDWIADDPWIGKKGPVTYTVSFIKDIFGKQLRHRSHVTQTRISDLEVYTAMIDMNKQLQEYKE